MIAKRKKVLNKKGVGISMIIVGVIGVLPYITLSMGPNNRGGRMSQATMNKDSVPVGLQDEDGDGILNKDDDFLKPMKNARDDDGDGIANRVDEDYEPKIDGTGRSNTTGNRAGQINLNKSEVVTSGQNLQVRARLRVMVQEKEQIEQAVDSDIVRLKNQNRFKKIFMGTDKEVVKDIQTKLDAYAQQIETLKKMSTTLTNPEDKVAVEGQIVQMEQRKMQMERLMIENSDGLSLLGWIKRLFN